MPKSVWTPLRTLRILGVFSKHPSEWNHWAPRSEGKSHPHSSADFRKKEFQFGCSWQCWRGSKSFHWQSLLAFVDQSQETAAHSGVSAGLSPVLSLCFPLEVWGEQGNPWAALGTSWQSPRRALTMTPYVTQLVLLPELAEFWGYKSVKLCVCLKCKF